MSQTKLFAFALSIFTLGAQADSKYDGRGHGESDYQYAWQALQEAKGEIKEKYQKVRDLLSKSDQEKIKTEQTQWQDETTQKCQTKTAHILRRLERQIELNRCQTDEIIKRIKQLDTFVEKALGTVNSKAINQAPCYAQVLPALIKKTKTPILLPDQHAISRVFDRNIIVTLESSSPKHYSLKFETERGCQRSQCLSGALHVYQGNTPTGILNPMYASTDTYTLKLAHDIDATLEKENGGGVAGKEFRWLKWQQGETSFALTVKNATESDFKTLANSAIRTGSWR